MKTVLSTELVFNCSLERAFKTPMLGDTTQFLVGYGIIPPVYKFTQDQTWGAQGGKRIPHTANKLFIKGGPVGLEKIYIRDENKYWKWGITEFYQWIFWISEIHGELFFEEIKDGSIKVEWKYKLHSKYKALFPLHWVLGNIFWKNHMKIGIQKMKEYAESDAKFLYD